MIEFRNVSTGYDKADVIHNISFTVPEASVTAFVGPNGCGKTTLLRAAAGQLPLHSGEIILEGKQVGDYERRELARTAAFMPQMRYVPAISVAALVAHGRFPYLGFSRRMRAEDKEAVWRALEATGTSDWAQRDLRELSGGERQRVYIAMAIAQDTKLVFLDEPTTYLDPGRQFELLELITSLTSSGKTVVMVLHDLAHALRYSSQIAVMDKGRLIKCAAPDEIYESGEIERVFSVRVHKSGADYYITL